MSSVLPQNGKRQAFAPVQISDLFGAYPDISDPLFNTLISQKKEFAELEPLIDETLEGFQGGSYRHQKFAVRYLTWYDRLLLIHDPGTGKSCIITHSAELFKNDYLKNPDDPTKIKRAYILLRGPGLIDNIRNEIVCKCTDRTYLTEMVLKSQDESIMKGNITRELKTWYEIMTYRDFANLINQCETDEQLEEFMSNIAIYVDEAHNVPTISDITGEQPIAATEEEAEEAGAPTPEESYYDTIFRAFHKGKRNKIVLATATPMNNLAIDIIPLINLILPLNSQGAPGQMPRWRKEQDAEFAAQPLEYFEPYFRGRISYIRALDTGAKPLPMGVQIPDYNTIVYPCPMSDFQYNVYSRAALRRGGGESQERFFDRQRQVSNFVFPDESFGIAGFEKYVEIAGDRYRFKNTPDGQHCRQLVRDEEGLESLSTKYSEIIRICQEKYSGLDVEVDESKGIVFIYFADYVRGSGAIMLGLCLQEHGYDEFRETRNIFISTQESSSTSRIFGPCTSTADARLERPARIPKRRRYAILTSKTPNSHIAPIFNTLNSYENRYGQYIQILIGSRTAREGINISNAITMMMASSSWNASSNWQAEERVFRSTSHIARLTEKRQRTGDPNAIINVETYNMVATYEPVNANDPGPIDPRLFAMAEQKDRSIRKIVRYLKQSSIDCYINYRRNVRSTDVDGSSVCDFMSCNYTCTGIREQFINDLDRTTKILYYSEDEVERASNAVKKLFSRFHSLKIEQIHYLLNTIDPIFVDMAIEKMITDNIKVLDRMGFFSYFRESQTGVIYLENDPFEVRAHPENTVYNSVLIGTQDPHNNSFHDFVTSSDIINEEPIIRQLNETDPNDPDFQIILESLSLMSKVKLLEQVILERKLTRTTDIGGFRNAVFSAFNHAIFEVKEPIDALRKTAIQINMSGKGRGRKRGPNSKLNINKDNITVSSGKKSDNFKLPSFDIGEVADTVILHTLLNQGSHDRTSYGVTTRFFKAEGQLRILKMSENPEWRDVNEYEDLVYNAFIQKQIGVIRSLYEDRFSIYGVVLPPNNELRIRDRESENPRASRSEASRRDARSINDGRICITWHKPDLVDILYRLGLSVQMDMPPPNVARQNMVDYLRRSSELDNYDIENFEHAKLIHFYQWYQSSYHRDDICDFIRQYFERTGRLFTGKVPSQVPTPIPNVDSIQLGGSQQTTPEYIDPNTILDAIASNTPLPNGNIIIQSSLPPVLHAVPHMSASYTQPPNFSVPIAVNGSYPHGFIVPTNRSVDIGNLEGVSIGIHEGVSGLQIQ